MHNNSTWGTDVEIFALALLLRTEILIYNTDLEINGYYFRQEV